MPLGSTITFTRCAGILTFMTCVCVVPRSSLAQRVDSARVAPGRTRVDTATRVVVKPPLSPRRAFLYSFLVPGYGQSVLKRPGAGALFVVTESGPEAWSRALEELDRQEVHAEVSKSVDIVLVER